MQKGTEGNRREEKGIFATDVDLRLFKEVSNVLKNMLLNLSPSCHHLVTILLLICHLASRQHPFLVRVLAETVGDGQRWPEMARAESQEKGVSCCQPSYGWNLRTVSRVHLVPAKPNDVT